MRLDKLLFITLLCLSCGKSINDTNQTSPSEPTAKTKTESSYGSSYSTEQLKLAINSASVSLVKLALKNGANPDDINSLGETALTLAIKKNFPSAIRLLIRSNADVNKKNKQGNAPYHVAILEKNLRAMKLLERSSKLNVNLKNEYVQTPLMLAVRAQSLVMTREVLTKKPNLKLRNRYGHTAEQLARKDSNQKLYFLIKDYRELYLSKDETKLIDIIESERKYSMNLIKELMQSEPLDLSRETLNFLYEQEDAHFRNYYLKQVISFTNIEEKLVLNILVRAVINNELSRTQELLGFFPNITIDRAYQNGRTLLSYAVGNVNYQMVKLLYKYGEQKTTVPENFNLKSACDYLPRKVKSSQRRARKAIKNYLGC